MMYGVPRSPRRRLLLCAASAAYLLAFLAALYAAEITCGNVVDLASWSTPAIAGGLLVLHVSAYYQSVVRRRPYALSGWLSDAVAAVVLGAAVGFQCGPTVFAAAAVALIVRSAAAIWTTHDCVRSDLKLISERLRVADIRYEHACQLIQHATGFHSELVRDLRLLNALIESGVHAFGEDVSLPARGRFAEEATAAQVEMIARLEQMLRGMPRAEPSALIMRRAVDKGKRPVGAHL